MESLKMFLFCAAVLAAISARGLAAPQFNPFALQSKRSLANPNERFNGLAPAFDAEFGAPPFDFGHGRAFPAADFDGATAGFPQLPPTADFSGFAGFPSADFGAGFPHNLPPVDSGFSQGPAAGFGVPQLTEFPALPANFGSGVGNPFSGVPAPIAADGLLVPASQLQPQQQLQQQKQQPLQQQQPQQLLSSQPQSTQSNGQNSIALNVKTPSSAYDNDGINTTPSPPARTVPDLALDLTPPPYSPPNPSPVQNPENPSPTFSVPNGSGSAPNAPSLTGQPFDYSAPPNPSPLQNPENPSAASSVHDGSGSAPNAPSFTGQPFDYSAPPDPSGQGPENPSQATVDGSGSASNVPPLPGRPFDYSAPRPFAPAPQSPQSRPINVVGSSGAAGSSPDGRPSFEAVTGRNAPVAGGNDGRNPVFVVYGGDGAGSNAHSAKSYSGGNDANAVRNSFDEIAGILSGIVKSVPGDFAGESNNSIATNSKRESSRTPFRYTDNQGGYKRD